MHDIKELVGNIKKYKNTIIQKDFKSKKNTVCYVIFNGKPVVLKWFAPGFKKNMKTEYSVLKRCSSVVGTPVPLEVDEKNHVILMSYIIGNNLCDIINDEKTSIDKKKDHMLNLAKWFFKFHNHFRSNDSFHIRGDSILRNFIFTDRIWGVDFEESRIGKPEEDIAGICSSILSTNPMFTKWKFLLCKEFIDYYEEFASWSLNDINSEIAYALLEKIQFRPEDEDILREYSSKIKERGFL